MRTTQFMIEHILFRHFSLQFPCTQLLRGKITNLTNLTMNSGESASPRAFNKLFTKNVPHILEKIFLSLDYESFKRCLDVSKSWNDLMRSERFQKFFREEIEMDLWKFSKDGSLSEVKIILSSFMVDVNCVFKRDFRSTPLLMASKRGCEEVVQLLLDRGADPNKASEDGCTPLHRAAWRGDKDVVQLLLDGGADPNKADEHGWTPLHCAARHSRKDVVRLLLKRGADPNKKDEDGETPLYKAAYEGFEDTVELLLERGADPNISIQNGNTPLIAAKGMKNKGVVRLLRERANENVSDSHSD